MDVLSGPSWLTDTLEPKGAMRSPALERANSEMGSDKMRIRDENDDADADEHASSVLFQC